MTGIIKTYRPKYGYGFLVDEQDREIFFSYRSIDRHYIEPGTKVEFDNVTEERKGLKAGKVKILEDTV